MKECDIILNIIALLEVRDLADKLKILITDDSKLLRKKLRAELEKLAPEHGWIRRILAELDKEG